MDKLVLFLPHGEVSPPTLRLYSITQLTTALQDHCKMPDLKPGP